MSHVRGRRGHARNGSGVPSLSQRVAMVLAGGAWLEARTCTTSLGNVVTFVDKLDASHVVTISGTLPAPAANVLFGGSSTVTVPGGGSVTGASNRAGSFWKKWSDATGGTAFHIFRPAAAAGDLCLAATFDVTQGATQVGYYYGASGAGTDPKDSFYVVGNGTASPANGRTVADLETAAYPSSAATFVRTELSAGAFAHYVKGTNVGSGALAGGGASTASSTQALRLFNNHTFSLPFSGDWWGSLFAPKILSAAELSFVHQYITRETGLVP